MLALKKLLAGHRQAIFSHYKVWRQAPLATFMTMMVLAVVLVLPMLLWMFTQNLQRWSNSWDTQHTIALYLKHELTPEQLKTILNRVLQLDGVKHAKLISPEQGLKDLQQDLNLRDSLAYLPENPLPAMIEVLPQSHLSNPQKIATLFTTLKLQPEVDLAQLDLQWVAQLHGIVKFIRRLTYALMGLLGLAVVMIIGNTLRLVVHKQQEELKVLKLIGASEAFIIRPFLYAGLGFGLGAAVLALGLMQLFFWMLDSAFKELFLSYRLPYTGVQVMWGDVVSLFVVSILLGLIAASISVKRQLALIEPSM